MMGLWADGWFYISSAGLLVSGILFFFLLGQYRVASEAADATEAAEPAEAAPGVVQEISAPAAIRPVYVPEEASSARVASHADAPEAKPEPKPEPKPKAEETPARRDPATSTGGISPAVVYLQNIKVELDDLHKDLRSLSKRVDDELASVSTRDEALIERLGELTRAVESLKAAAPAPAAEPASEPETPKPARKSRKAEKLPEPEAAAEPESAPAPEPVPEPVAEAVAAPAEIVIEVLPPPPAEAIPELKAAPSPDETIRMELGAIIAAPTGRSEEPAPVAAEPPPAEPAEPAEPIVAPPPEEKPRRGPVWPV